MPVPTEFTDEELAEFQQHGVTMPAPGKEPTGESNEPSGTATPTPSPTPTSTPASTPEANQHGDRQPGEQPRGSDGKFVKKDGEQVPSPEGQQTPPEGQQTPPEGQQQEPRMVPHEALHAERERNKKIMQQMQLLQTRTNALLQSRQQLQEQQPQMPELDKDPAGYIRALEQRLNQFEQLRQEQDQYREIDTGLEQDEQLFAAVTPDYEQASEYYVQSRAKELLRFNTPQKAQEILMHEARAIASQSWQRGMSAAETIYALAQARGYQAGSTATPTPSPTPAPTPTPSPTPAPTPTPTMTPADRIAAIQHGQQQTRSLSGGGGTATAELNAEALLAMSDEEFERAVGIGGKGVNTRFASIAGQ